MPLQHPSFGSKNYCKTREDCAYDTKTNLNLLSGSQRLVRCRYHTGKSDSIWSFDDEKGLMYSNRDYELTWARKDENVKSASRDHICKSKLLWLPHLQGVSLPVGHSISRANNVRDN